ncbi:Glucosamine-phosphate N-acetyltransferase-like protein [Podila epigama]|nr:Glucosamine-phosphate N-acetyltransferase-like protein [Podila epigama]
MSPQPQALFSSTLISDAVQSQLPDGYLMRPLEITDYNKGFYDCLAGLTVVGKVSEASFQEAFASMLQAKTVYHTVVIEELAQSRIVATGTLIVEQKFLRGCAKAGHIEDIVVHDSQRGKKFGIRLIDQLKHIGNTLGCYKLLLTCSESNEPFYEKSGFVRKDLHMAQYLNQQPQQQQQQQQQQKQPASTVPFSTEIVSSSTTAPATTATTATTSLSSLPAVETQNTIHSSSPASTSTKDSSSNHGVTVIGGMSREFNSVTLGESVYVK